MLPGSALYLYCVVPATSAVPVVTAPALDGGAVQAISHGGLAVLVHQCRPEPYQGCEEEVRRWIAAHNAVVEEAWAATGSVLPMSFDVIVSPAAGRTATANLTGWLAEHGTALHGRLRAVTGRAEVGVQVLWDTSSMSAPGEQPGGESAPAPRGRAFFARQQQQRQARQELARRADLDCRRYVDGLAALADEVRVNKPRPVPGKHMVLNLSLLVAKDVISRVGEYLAGLNDEPGAEVRFTGPWPPYSFAGKFNKIEHENQDE